MAPGTRQRKILIAATALATIVLASAVLTAVNAVQRARRCEQRRVTPSTTVGPVTVTYDPDLKATARVLAGDGAAAVPIIAALFGQPAPTGAPLVVNAYSDAAEFQPKLGRTEEDSEVGGISSPTGQAYVHWWLRHGHGDSRDVAVPFLHRQDFMHELSHLVSYRLFPVAQALGWPFWLGEGLADLATREVLSRRSPDEARTFDEYELARWQEAARQKGLPASGRALVAREKTGDLAGRYASAYYLLRHLKDSGRLPQLMRLLAAGREAEGALAELIGDVDAVWAQVRSRLEAEASVPIWFGGSADRIGDSRRLLSRPGLDARLVLTDRLYDAAPAIEARFALRPVGGREIDVFPRYSPTRHDDYIKVAILESAIHVYRCAPGGGEVLLAEARRQRPIAMSDDGALVWHRLQVTWQGPLVVTLDGEVTRIDLPAPRADTPFRVAFGTYDGAVHLADLQVRAPPAR